MALPLDYYKILGVSTQMCSRDTLVQALEKALTNPPSVGYSQQCLLARGSALKRAAETLLDTQGRRAYDDSLAAGEITEEVPDEFVPGVLALLVECGDPTTAVAAGEEWLSTHQKDARARDVALTTALAHKAVADKYAKKLGDAASAANMLEVAGELLRRHRAAPQLQADVAAELAELQPQLACQLAALPLEIFQERERGVQVAISVLTNTSGGRKGMGKQQFLDRLSESLIAAEQLVVFEAAGRAYAELPSELYEVALAYIADATSSGKPALLEQALAALEAAAAAVPPGATGQASDIGVRQLAERRAIDERNRRQVAFAVCQLLLGDTAAAGETMGLHPDSDMKCERSLMAFIKANSPDNEDLLPGLCVLGQRWVADVALASFRGTQGTPFSLEEWFASAPVRRYLARRDHVAAPDSPLLAAAKQAAALLTSPVINSMAGILSLMGLLASGTQQLEPEGQLQEEGVEGGEEEQYPPSDAQAAEMRQQVAPEPAAPAAAAAPPAAAAAPARREAAAPAASQQRLQGDGLPFAGPGQVPAGRSAAEVTRAAAGSDMSVVDMRELRGARELKPRHTARPEVAAAAAATMQPPVVPPPSVADAAQAENFDANEAFAMLPVDQLTPLDGEARMWDTVEQRSVRWGRLVSTVALLAGGGFLLGRSMLLARAGSGGGFGSQGVPPSAAPVATTQPAAVAAVAPKAAAVAAPSLSRTEAADIIGRWQSIKALALGPQHDVKALGGILRGEVLQQWRERAQQIQKKGWHYVHSMEGSQINSVSVDAASGAARVSATFREAVEAHRGAKEPMQAFRSEYSVDYELVREGNSWVITAAAVRY